jgi:hypothetical protein
MRGTVDLDLFFATRGASASLVEGGIAAINGGRALVITGEFLVAGGGYVLLGGATALAAYLGGTYLYCLARGDT